MTMKKKLTLLVGTMLLVGAMANALLLQSITPNGDTIHWYIYPDSTSATIYSILPPPAGSFTIPDSLVWHDTASEVKRLAAAFEGCTNLVDVNISSSVEAFSLTGTFCGCTSLVVPSTYW